MRKPTEIEPMRSFRKACLVILLLGSPSFRFGRFVAAQSQAPQRQEPSGAQARVAEQKQPDYSQEAYVIERKTTFYRFERDGIWRREMSVRWETSGFRPSQLGPHTVEMLFVSWPPVNFLYGA
jgi:hypothetical protein